MKSSLFLLPLALGLVGCSSNTNPATTGVLYDSAVSGVKYRSSLGPSGVTDASGAFAYQPGDPVTFKVGGITLGTVAASEKLPLTALDGGQLTQKVANMARLLQTLDTDGNPENGIELLPGIHDALKDSALDLSIADSAMDTALNGVVQSLAAGGINRQVRNRAEALEHLESTLTGVFDMGATTKLADGTEITKQIVKVDEGHFVPYPGSDSALKASFPKGFPLSIGSGLAYRSTGADGTLSFWGLTDRGPNADSPNWQVGTTVTKTKIFPAPSFNPRLVQLEARKGQVRVVGTLPLKTADGGPISGLPLPTGTVGSSGETALSEGLKALSPGTDLAGLDPEGIAIDPANPNNLWLCDEYGPFLIKVDATTGKVLAKVGPGSGLPSLLQYRQPNRGFEGIAISGGKVYAFVQSILDFSQVIGTATAYSTSKARFLRFVEYDPATGATRMFALPHDVDQYAKSKNAKLGDLVALGNNRFLLIEQGADKNGVMRNLIYLIDLTGATDLTGKLSGGKELEVLTTDAAVVAAGVTMIKKQLVFDLRRAGSEWSAEKAEGLSVLPDGQTLVVVNDNDFGLRASMSGNALSSPDPTEYTVDSVTGVITYGGVASAAAYQIQASTPTERPSRMWFIKLPKPLSQYTF